MPVVVVVGAQWGDEGKGKLVDVWARHADAVVRFAGGANAGHTLVVKGEKRVFHLIPSGALHERIHCVVGQGTVLDPEVLLGEIDWLGGRGLLDGERVRVSDRAHVVLPVHKLVDELREKGARALGTTKRGIGPAYEDKAARRGVRVGDLLDPERLAQKVQAILDAWAPTLTALSGDVPEAAPIVEAYAALGKRLAPYVADTGVWVGDAIKRGEKILLEGAQGTLLDIDHGTFPYVTSSTAVAGGACAGAGIGPTAVDRVLGITKAYTTRVGAGPFPTELEGPEGDRLRDAGAEYGATTGRPRRCGWLDAVALRYAVRVNGMDGLALTKLDVLSGLERVRLCVGYQMNGERIDTLPWDGLETARPIYEDLPGWSADLGAARNLEDLPKEARTYVARIEELVSCKIDLVSVGADREQSIGDIDPFG